MSLLMKALEKAAKDRGEVQAEQATTPAAARAAARTELALEPIANEAPARAEAAARPAAGPARAAAAPAPSTAREQAQAATVLQAGARSAPAGLGAYLRARPVATLAVLAAVLAAGFGIYVYLQIFHPGLFLPQPPLAKAPPPAPPAAIAPAPPLLAEPLLQARASEPEPAAPAPAETRVRPPAAPPPAPAAPEPRNTIVVSPGSPEPALDPLLVQAYAALQANQLAQARELYEKLLRGQPKNIDALLGLAAIAALQGSAEEASARYLQILELEPQNAFAQSGLIALFGRSDPLAAESKLKQLIAREPSAYLYFTLGNLYADQSQWAAAQQAYFQAHALDPANPDYAYNLAVGLEQVSQPRLALGFYRRALELASARGHARFDLSQVKARIARLAAQLD
jgi:tetratricopeptide (TPR) repeat protein